MDRYVEDDRIWHISGYVQPFNYTGNKESFFWRYMNCWGWATWRNRWQYFSKDPKFLKKTFSKSMIYNFNLEDHINAWAQVTGNLQGRLNTWAIFWYATIFTNKGLCLTPTKSYARNIGHDGSGDGCGTNKKLMEQELSESVPAHFPFRVYEDYEMSELQKAEFKKLLTPFNKIKRLFVVYFPKSNYIIKSLKRIFFQ